MLVRIFRRRSLILALAGAMLALLAVTLAAAQTSPYQPGELFVSVGGDRKMQRSVSSLRSVRRGALRSR